MRQKFLITGLIMIGLTLASCRKDYDFDKLRDPVWEPEIALPIAVGDLGIDDLIEQDSNSVIHRDSTGLITLIYDGELISIEPDLVVPINQTTYNDNVTLSGPEGTALIGGGTVTTSFTQDVTIDNLNVNGVSVGLDSLILNTGTLGITLNNGLDHDAFCPN